MALLNTSVGPERVQVFDQPIGNVSIPGAGISTLAMLIGTTQVGAPANAPTGVTSLDEFVTLFGGPDEVLNGVYYAVKGYYDNAGSGATLIVVNCGSAPTVSDYIGSAALGTGLRAFDAVDDIGLLCAPGLPLAQAYLVQSACIDYAETIRAEFGSTLSTTFALVEIPKEIDKANSDTTLITGQLQAVTGAGPWVLDIQNAGTAVAATGTYTVVDYTQLALDTVTVNGTVLTEGTEWVAAVSNNATATSLAAAIHALTPVNAAAVGAVITVTAATAGLVGNAIATLTSDAVNLTVSGATLSGGLDGGLALASITAGMIVTNTALSYVGVISAVDDTLDKVTVTPNPTSFFTVGADVLIKKPSAVTYKNSVVSNAVARVAAWYYNAGVVVDESTGALPGAVVVVDSVGHVAGMIARIDANNSIGGVSHAPAGLRYAGLAGLSGLALSISERKDAEPLRLNFINRITSFGSGPVVFGGYSADSGVTALFTADEQMIQVMRTLQFIKASLEPGLRVFIWENFSPATQGQVKAAIESFLRNNSYLFPAGLPESSQFKVISVEPTQDELDQGLLRVRLQVRPNKAVKFIEISMEFPIPAV
jgi:hypothetical protein